MIYGANGYTGELISRAAKARGLEPILAGRNRDAVTALGRELALATRVFSCARKEEILPHLEGIQVVLHCAGPFSATSEPMLQACLSAKVHYLDITGEITVFERILSQSKTFRDAGILAIPGVGFDIVPTDCLAALLKEKLPDADRLEMVLSPAGALSPGTLKTMVEGFYIGTVVRRQGRIRVLERFEAKEMPYQNKKVWAVGIAWGDVASAFYTTGIPNIRVYLRTTKGNVRMLERARKLSWLLGKKWVRSVLQRYITWRMPGPSESARAESGYGVWGIVTNGAGKSVALGVETSNGYTFTVDAALASVERVLEGKITAGAYTPAMAFGANFAASLPELKIVHI